MSDGHMTVSRERLLVGDVFLAHRALLACSVCFVVDQLLSMDEVRARTFGPEVALGLASDAMGGNSRDDQLMS